MLIAQSLSSPDPFCKRQQLSPWTQGKLSSCSEDKKNNFNILSTFRVLKHWFYTHTLSSNAVLCLDYSSAYNLDTIILSVQKWKDGKSFPQSIHRHLLVETPLRMPILFDWQKRGFPEVSALILTHTMEMFMNTLLWFSSSYYFLTLTQQI